MLNWQVNRIFRILLVAMISLVVLGLRLPKTGSDLLRNYSSLLRIHGHDFTLTNRYLAQALDLNPDDPLLRWEVGDGLIHLGNLNLAVKTLLPLIDHLDTYPTLPRKLIGLLFATAQDEKALQVFETMEIGTALPPGISAHLLIEDMRLGGVLDSGRRVWLLADVFGMNMSLTEFNDVRQKFEDPQLWETKLGLEIKSSLDWLARTGPGQEGDESAKFQESNLQRVAAMMGMPTAAVELGPQLIQNGSFEVLDQIEETPSFWHYYFVTTGQICNTRPCNVAAFAVGIDGTEAFSGKNSLRIDGLWVEHNPDRDPARAGMMYPPIKLAADMPYLVSFVYKTNESASADSRIWFSYPAVFSQIEQYLPPTNGKWREVLIVDWNRTGSPAIITPVLSLYGEGTVWFDQVSINQLKLLVQYSWNLPDGSLVQFLDVNK